MADQVEDVLRVVFVFSSLSGEKQTLASLRSVCGIWVGDILSLLITHVCAEVLVL